MDFDSLNGECEFSQFGIKIYLIINSIINNFICRNMEVYVWYLYTINYFKILSSLAGPMNSNSSKRIDNSPISSLALGFDSRRDESPFYVKSNLPPRILGTALYKSY